MTACGAGQRDPGGDDREQPQHRAAVGEQQDHDHTTARVREQQGAVDALEGLARVRGDAGRPGDMRRQAVGAGVGGGASCRRRCRPPCPSRRCRGSAARSICSASPSSEGIGPVTLPSTSPPCRTAGVGGDLGPVGRRSDRRGARRRPPPAACRARRRPACSSRTLVDSALAGQPGHGVVLLGAGQFAGQRSGDEQHRDPEAQRHPLGLPARQRAGDRPVHPQPSSETDRRPRLATPADIVKAINDSPSDRPGVLLALP